MHSPAISVCMPMYNASRYLRECIDSVLAQTFADFEFLIVDDGSTDNSVEIVESYSDPRIRLIKRQHDYIASLNCLLDEAKGEFIARMDADDIMFPHRLKTQFECLSAHIELDILGSDTVTNLSPLTTAQESDIIEVSLRDLAEGNCVCHPSVMIRRKKFEINALRYNRDYIFAEDYKLWAECVVAGLKIANLSDQLLFYRMHDQQVSVQKQQAMFRIAERIGQECKDFAFNSIHKDYRQPIIGATTNELTIIIPFLNEGAEVERTVSNIRLYLGQTVDIIVVNDHSYDGINYPRILSQYNVIYIANNKRIGVAASRDLAIVTCRTPYFLLLDSHMRLYESDSIRRIEHMLKHNGRCIICSQTIPLILDEDQRDLVLDPSYNKGYGAYHPFSTRSLLPDSIWYDYERDPNSDIEQVPMILGGAYASSRQYWLYLKGLYGLRGYGFDEAFISYKVWREGGQCLLLKNFIMGHLYRPASPYQTFTSDLIFNSLMICKMFFSEDQFMWSLAFAMEKEFDSAITAYQAFSKTESIINDIAYYEGIFTQSHSSVMLRHFNDLKTTIHYALRDWSIHLYSIDELADIINNTYSLSLVNGLGAIILLLSEKDAVCPSNLFKSTYGKFCDHILYELNSPTIPIGFYHGISGVGWIILYHGFISGQLQPNDCRILEAIDKVIITRLADGTLLNKSFGDGIGGIIYYAYSRLCSMDFLKVQTQTPLLSTSGLAIFHEKCVEVVDSAGFDKFTYFHSLRLLSLLSRTDETSNWCPKITDWIELPSNYSTKEQSSEDASLCGILGLNILYYNLIRKTSFCI